MYRPIPEETNAAKDFVLKVDAAGKTAKSPTQRQCIGQREYFMSHKWNDYCGLLQDQFYP